MKKNKFFWYNVKMLEITIDNCQKCDLVNIFALVEEI